MKEIIEFSVKVIDTEDTGITRCIEVVRSLPRDEHNITFKTRWSPEQHTPDTARLTISAMGVSLLRRAFDTLDQYKQVPPAHRAVEVLAPSELIWVTNDQGEQGVCIRGHVYSRKDNTTQVDDVQTVPGWRTV